MKIGEHRGREIRLAEHSKKFEVGSTTEDIATFDSYEGAVAFIDREATAAAKGRRLSLEVVALIAGVYSSSARDRADLVVTGVNRGSRRLTIIGIPAGKEARDIYVRHAVVGDLLDERDILNHRLAEVSALLAKLNVPHGQGHGRIETVEEYERIVGEVERRHAAALILADEIAKQRAAPSVPTAEIVSARDADSPA